MTEAADVIGRPEPSTAARHGAEGRFEGPKMTLKRGEGRFEGPKMRLKGGEGRSEGVGGRRLEWHKRGQRRF